MRTLTILVSFLVVGLAIGWLVWFLAPQLRPEYTAEAFIRVLPGTAKLKGLDLGPACGQCGGMMQRTGSCYTCSSCGNNTGCG
jgi:hypothetical protein